MSSTSLVTRSTCRVCDGPLVPVLSLGKQQIAGAFGAATVRRRVPLDLMRCDTAQQDACGLVQLRHTVPGCVLYDSYWYRSGINQTMTDNLHEIAQHAERLAGLVYGDHVVDIGCNDGTLLDGYRTRKIRTVGFDPSDVAEHAEAKGHRVIRDFFRPENCPPAKVITSVAMFYDLEDPVAFAHAVASRLAPGGVWALELHYLPAMLDANGFDAIVHEHLGYYTLAVLERVLGTAGLEVISAETNAINGGSLRVFAGRRGEHARTPEQTQQLRALRVSEFELKLDQPGPYDQFRERVRVARDQLYALCHARHQQGQRIHVYGASTKGNTILQYANLGPDVIDVAADRNPDKWGTTTATGIPIVSEEESRAMRPDFYLALPWHFMSEFYERERAFLDRGGEFIVPLPNVATTGVGRLE